MDSRRTASAQSEAMDGMSSGCAGCQLDSGERCLATSGKRSPSKRRAEQKSTQPQQQQQQELDELVHVLVTRPEIASKPRDHIIFEGDMDLRTTFETSYEALAKMRLDQWKKYQEVTMKQQAASSSHQHARKSPTGASNHHHHHQRPRGHTKANSSSRQMSRASTIAAPDSNDIDIDSDEAPAAAAAAEQRKGVSSSTHMKQPVVLAADRRPADISRAVEPTTTPRSRTPFAVADTNSQNIHDDDGTDWDYHYNLDKSSRRARNSSPQQQQQNVDDSPYKHQLREQQQQQQVTPSAAARTPEAETLAPVVATAADYVDPDLAPLIVYDANMNRLERVGMRKRSKYRPSTSLRSGARGLFGDQVPEPSQEPKIDTSGRVSRAEDKGEFDPDELLITALVCG